MSQDKLPTGTLVETFFAVVGPSQETLTCSVFETGTGRELRLSYSDGYVMQSEPFPPGPDLAERIAAKAEEWRHAWLEKGFKEVPPEH
jgi:hypothetical protein